MPQLLTGPDPARVAIDSEALESGDSVFWTEEFVLRFVGQKLFFEEIF